MTQPSTQRDSHRTARAVVGCLLLLAFYLIPWLRIDETSALLMDLSARQFHLFGQNLKPENALPLLWLALSGISLLSLITVLFGRLWCGYTCPQTVLTRVFRGITRFTQLPGSLQPLSPVLKHALWASIALWTGISFVGYFSPIADLVHQLRNLSLGGWESFWIGFYALATWANVIYLHEQVCTHLCPYSRMQQLIADSHTPTIQYNARRGEPRGARDIAMESVLNRPRGLLDVTTANDYVFRAAHPAFTGTVPKFNPMHLGDCIDCNACVDVCPIGLDIRNGHSSNCIECSACVDACNGTMARNQFSGGLIHRSHGVSPSTDNARALRIKPLVFTVMTLTFVTLAILTANTLP